MTTIILLAVIVILVLIVIGIYNRLVSLRQSVRQGIGDIDAQLRQQLQAAEQDLLLAHLAELNALSPEDGEELQLAEARELGITPPPVLVDIATNLLPHYVRKRISGTTEQPRLRVSRSTKHIYAQIIDDVQGKTLCAASSLEEAFVKEHKKGADKNAAAASVGRLAGRRLLLVEDVAVNRELVQTLLREFDVDIVTAENGEEAVAAMGRIDSVFANAGVGYGAPSFIEISATCAM